MAAITVDEGLPSSVLQKYGQTLGKATVAIRLFTAVAGGVVTKATVKANLTEVGAVMGYAAKVIGNADFAAVLDTVGHLVIASATYTWIFTAGAGLTILGWYSTDAGNVHAEQVELFAVAVVIPAAGGSLQINLNDQYQNC